MTPDERRKWYLKKDEERKMVTRGISSDLDISGTSDNNSTGQPKFIRGEFYEATGGLKVEFLTDNWRGDVGDVLAFLILGNGTGDNIFLTDCRGVGLREGKIIGPWNEMLGVEGNVTLYSLAGKKKAILNICGTVLADAVASGNQVTLTIMSVENLTSEQK